MAPVDKETGRRIIQNHIILWKNTPLPCEASQMFYTMTDGQEEVEVTITQGEDTSPEYINEIATHKFKLPPDRPAGCPIKVTYSYDVNQRMHCKFEDIQSGRTLEVNFCLNQNGEIVQSNAQNKTEQLEVFKVE